MKDKIILILFVFIFGGFGIYITFFASSTSKFDSQVKAYKVEYNEKYDIDGTIYYPIYYFRLNNQEYICEAKSGSSSAPSKSKNIVYYDSTNPQKCKTQYETTSSKFAGIICLVLAVLIIFFGFIKKNNLEESEYEEANSRLEEKAIEIMSVVQKIQLIIKRVILGIIIFVLLIFVLIDTMLLKQTIKSKDYIPTTATYVEKNSEASEFSECLYVFYDKQNIEHEITVSCSDNITIKDKIKVKYNEKNPKDFYEESTLLDKNGITWYAVKVVAIVLLIILFFNKKLLNSINFSTSSDIN